MLVSAVIPAFGRSRTLSLAVASASMQTGLPTQALEVIVVDDASPEPIQPPAGTSNLKLVRLPRNLGAAGARNAGIEASHGEFIAFLDSDDVWLPHKLESQLALAEQLTRSHDRSKFVLSCGFYIPKRFKDAAELRIPKETAHISDFVAGCWMCPGSTLFCHRSAFERTGPFKGELRRLEDYEWMLRFAKRGGQLHVSSNPGAIIAPSSLPKLQPVQNAINTIRGSINADPALELSTSDLRSMESYFELELTAAYLGDGRKLKALLHLLKSFCLKPRLQASLQNFWHRSDDVPLDVANKLRELTDCVEQDK